MTTPQLVLRTAMVSPIVNNILALSDLTSRNGSSWTELDGDCGSDFWYYGGVLRTKFQGGGRAALTPVVRNGDPALTMTNSWSNPLEITWNQQDVNIGLTDSVTSDVFANPGSRWGTFNFANSQTQCGVTAAPPCTSDLNHLIMLGYGFDGGATWQASASLADGSQPAVSMAIPASGAWQIEVLFSSRLPTTMNLSVLRTAVSGSPQNLQMGFISILKCPVTRKRSTGGRNAANALGIFGGAR